MACPHSLTGKPSACSQCVGSPARKVERDPVTGQLTIDGKPVETRKFSVNYGYQPSPSRRGRPPKREAAAVEPDPDDVE